MRGSANGDWRLVTEDWEFAIRLAQHTSIYEDIEPVVLGFISHDSISRNRRKDTIGVLRILKKNRHVLLGLFAVIAAAIVGAFLYFNYRSSQNQEAQGAMYQAVFEIALVNAAARQGYRCLRVLQYGGAKQRQQKPTRQRCSAHSIPGEERIRKQTGIVARG